MQCKTRRIRSHGPDLLDLAAPRVADDVSHEWWLHRCERYAAEKKDAGAEATKTSKTGAHNGAAEESRKKDAEDEDIDIS
jgi:hypothetical protein